MRISTATAEDLPAVLNVLDGALLQVELDRLKRAIDTGDVLVAVPGGSDGDDSSERILGVLVLDGTEITAIAVRRRRRGQGIGTALVEAALDRRDELVAEFDGRVIEFWQSVGFEVTPLDASNRYRGRRKR